MTLVGASWALHTITKYHNYIILNLGPHGALFRYYIIGIYWFWLQKGKQKYFFSYLLLWTGYIIYYSTDVNAEIHDWVIEPVVGNRLTHQIQELTLDTPYYFKIQARNSKGMGPMSEAVQFRTPKGKAPWAKGFNMLSKEKDCSI